jgi:hypothetical protein
MQLYPPDAPAIPVPLQRGAGRQRSGLPPRATTRKQWLHDLCDNYLDTYRTQASLRRGLTGGTGRGLIWAGERTMIGSFSQVCMG